MKRIAKALVLFGLLGSTAWAHAVVGCNRWGCGQNSPVVDGARAGSVDASGLVLDSIQTPRSAPFVLRAPVAQPLPFMPGWGQNLNSPLVGGAAPAGAASLRRVTR